MSNRARPQRKPIHERGKRGGPVCVAPDEIRYRELPASNDSAESVDAWMARTGMQPETLPGHATSGKHVTAWNGRTVTSK